MTNQEQAVERLTRVETHVTHLLQGQAEIKQAISQLRTWAFWFLASLILAIIGASAAIVFAILSNG